MDNLMELVELVRSVNDNSSKVDGELLKLINGLIESVSKLATIVGGLSDDIEQLSKELAMYTSDKNVLH